jgi:DNA-binding CsgD family transcriptional regulator
MDFTPGTSLTVAERRMPEPAELRRRVSVLLREGRSDKRIAKALGLSREQVTAEIAAIVDEARLDRQERVAALAKRAGIVDQG